MAKDDGNMISNREVKDSAFTTYFGEPENASQLYAALTDEEVAPKDITYVRIGGESNQYQFSIRTQPFGEMPPYVRAFLVHPADQGSPVGGIDSGCRNHSGGK